MKTNEMAMDLNEFSAGTAKDFALLAAGAVGSFLGINRVITIFKKDSAEASNADAIKAKAQADTAIYDRLLHALEIERGTRASLVRKLDQQNELMELQSQQLAEQAKQIQAQTELIREQSIQIGEQTVQIREQSEQIRMLTDQIRSMQAEHDSQTKALRMHIVELGGNLSDFRDSQRGEFR